MKGVKVVALDVVAIEVVEEAGEPAHHDLVVVPAMDQLAEERLSMVAAQRGEDGFGDIGLESLAVASVELFGVVMGGFLRAHVVNGCICLVRVEGGREGGSKGGGGVLCMGVKVQENVQSIMYCSAENAWRERGLYERDSKVRG